MTPRWLAILKTVAFACAGVMALFIVLDWCSPNQVNPSRVMARPAEVPSVSAVSPSLVPNDLDTTITITGTGFTRELSGTVVTNLPTIALNGTRLAEVGWMSSTIMTATVPWGLNPGLYTLTVTNPDGQSGSLAGGVTVSQGIGVWTSGGPYGGSVTVLLQHPVDKTTLYAVATGSGLFRSLNSGDRWELIFSGAGDQFHSVALSLSSPVTLYAQKWGQGIYRSDDGGTHWTALPFPGQACSDWRIFASPLEAQTVFVTANCAYTGGLFKSLDRGQSWTSVTTGLTDLYVTALAFDPVDTQVLYAGTSHGNVFRSVDGGESWSPMGKPDLFISDLVVNPFGSREPWAAGADGSGHWGYLWKYMEDDWVQVLPGTGAENEANSILFSPTISGTMWIGTFQGALKSTNGGSTWGPAGGPALDVNQLVVDFADPQMIYLGIHGQGILRTSNGGASWKEANQGLTGVIPNGLAIHPDDPAVVYATAHGTGVFKSKDGGGSWRELPTHNLIPGSPLVDLSDPRRVYTSEGSSLVISTDDGATWHKVLVNPPSAYADCCSAQVLSLMALQQPGSLLMGVGFQDRNATSYGFVGGGIYTSQDYGESWTYVEVGRDIAPVTVLAADPADPATIYAGSGKLGVLQGAGVWKSENGGSSWSRCGLPDQEITGIAVDPSKTGLVYATNLDKFYTSPDGGATWSLRGDPIGLEHLLAVATTPTMLYRYGWQGMARSLDGGLHWERAAGSLGSANISVMATTHVDGRVVLYIGSGGSASGAALKVMALAPTADTLLTAGVYRNTLRLEFPRIYIPLIRR